MYKRFVAVVSTAILLIAGMVSSAVCEMTCLPQASTGACCGQQMQQTVHLDHCNNIGTGAVINGHQCDLPQDNPTTFTADVSVIQLHAIHSTSTMLPTLSARISIVGRHDLSLGAFLKRPSITPLRI
jgi:hypothetical protein